MAGVLGRVVSGDLERPRGPDAIHRIRVPRAWLKHGALVQLELPRHLVCAACDGGGCDTCERSGGVTLRQRGEPADVVQVALPAEKHETFVIRLPERGGLAAIESGLPRGHLLLRVEPSAEADASVTLADKRPSIAAIRRAVSQHAVSLRALSLRPAAGGKPWLLVGSLVLGVILLVIWLLSRR